MRVLYTVGVDGINGYYDSLQNEFQLSGGSVTVRDLFEGNYTIEFNNVEATEVMDGFETVTIKGSYNGFFETIN